MSDQLPYQIIATADFAADVGRHEVVFILNTLPDWQSLADAAPAGSAVVLLDGSSDALQAMAAYLQTVPPASVDAIHLLSHGSSGSLDLGSTSLSSATLAEHQDQLIAIGSSLTDAGDILLYGCNVAEGGSGIDFVSRLAQITGADIAASNDITGLIALDGDWDLEVNSAPIEADIIQPDNYNFALATLSSPNDSSSYTWGDTETFTWTDSHVPPAKPGACFVNRSKRSFKPCAA
ncbi:MAG: DUF4347 domain-containing protein [Desulfuromonadaceae bacterium]|nr:DUF4347 domain-containing protein [Desulfuromonadaceae bacterium]